MKKLLVLFPVLLFAVSCSSSKEKYEDRQEEAREDYDESLKQAEEEYSEDQKEDAEDMIEDSDGVQVNEDEGQIKVED